jgi:hypothetical protein
MRQKNADAQHTMVVAWNKAHPVGCEVEVTRDLGETVRTRTRSAAQMLGGHTAVVWLDGFCGCYALERVKAIEWPHNQLRPTKAH